MGIYSATLAVWVEDESEGKAETRAFLDRRIEGVMKFEKFDRVILTHTCRDQAELAYGHELVAGIRGDELLSDLVGDKLTHIATTTREPSEAMGRMTDWIRDGRLAAAVGGLDPATDRVMICGSMGMLQEHKALCEAAGMAEGSNAEPGQFVIEKAFVD